MLRELPLFGALAPSLLLYFIGAILLYIILDQLISALSIDRFLWHPPLARLGIFLCLFSLLVLSTRP
jgi:protein AaeX